MLTPIELATLIDEINLYSHEEDIHINSSEGTYGGGDTVITTDVLYDILKNFTLPF